MTTKKLTKSLLPGTTSLMLAWYLEDRGRMNGNILTTYANKIIKLVKKARGK